MSDTVKVENVIIALRNMQAWCGVLAEALGPLKDEVLAGISDENKKELVMGRDAPGTCKPH